MEYYKEYLQKFPETEFQNAVQSYTFLQQKKMKSVDDKIFITLKEFFC
jgi:hypothetical protein